MVDMTVNLGRPVPTAQQVFDVIRPQMKIARACSEGIFESTRAGHLRGDADLNLADGADDIVETVVFQALLASAIESVGQWSKDSGMVFDRKKAESFIGQCVGDAFGRVIDWAEVA